eukprot:COSAG02_NODE_6427_length_3576_cov_1.716422_3_plen_91_part_00
MSYRESDSHPRAFGVLKAWLSTARGAKAASPERDLLDVTLKKATPLQLRTGGVAGNALFDDDMLDSATDPQVGFDIGSAPGPVRSICRGF